jgi:hypothetical protein
VNPEVDIGVRTFRLRFCWYVMLQNVIDIIARTTQKLPHRSCLPFKSSVTLISPVGYPKLVVVILGACTLYREYVTHVLKT